MLNYFRAASKVARTVQVDDVDTMELVDMLSGVNLPQRHKTTADDEFSMSTGFRLIDMRILRSALSASQVCKNTAATASLQY